MDHQLIGRILLAIFCGMQGAGTIAIDMNRTHATHPGWLGHARFHVVWQTASVTVFSLIEIGLILIRGPHLAFRFYLAAAFAAVPILAFFVALFARNLYGGTLSDPQGMPPLSLRIGGKALQVDMNIVAEILGLLSLGVVVAIYRGT